MSARATAPADASAVARIEQPHGGALLVGGVPGNKGGGRPKEVLRERARGLLGTVLDRIAALLDTRTPVLAHDAAARILSDPRVLALGDAVLTVLQTVVREHAPTQLRPGELQRFADVLGKYGLGTQQEVEKAETHRYVVALPPREPLPPHMRNAPREVTTLPPVPAGARPG